MAKTDRGRLMRNKASNKWISLTEQGHLIAPQQSMTLPLFFTSLLSDASMVMGFLGTSFVIRF